MKKFSRLIMIFILGFALFLGVGIHSSAASNYYNQVKNKTVTDGYYILKVKNVEQLQNALKTAQKKATSKKPYKIIVKPGTYKLEHSLNIFSNTYLYAKNVTFKQKKGATANMIIVGNNQNKVTGYYFKNITIDGGNWNENGNGNTAIKAANAKNFTLKNATIQNTRNGHLTEIAGCNGVKITNCKYKKQVLSSNVYKYEAIQLDIITKKHFVGYKYQDLPLKNVIITKCSFENVPRGVGSHTAILNDPINGLEITNNTFKNVKSCAIQILNAKNCTISNNNILSAPRGIAVFSCGFSNQDTYLATTLAKEGKTKAKVSIKYKTPASNMKIKVESNTITLKGTDKYASYENAGIYISGYNATKAYKSSSGDKIPKGNYYLSGITVKNNTIKGNGHGIRLSDVRKAAVENNILAFTGTLGKINYYGINLNMSTKSTEIKNNKTEGYLNGIFVIDASAGSVTDNIISSANKYGISLEKASAASVNNNVIKTTLSNGIHLWNGSSANTIMNNQITSAGGKAVYVGGKSSVKEICGNKCTSCVEEIVVSRDSDVKSVQ